jgi:hypothetical protein
MMSKIDRPVSINKLLNLQNVEQFKSIPMKIKKYVLFLFILFAVKSFAGQIPLGLTSDNLFAWGVWENEKGVLKHYLYVYNKTKKEIKLQIKQKKFKPAGNDFEEVKVDKEIYKTALAPARITKLDYPANSDRMSYMNFLEDGKSIGIIPFNMDEPMRSFVDNKYKFYSNDVINQAKAGLWMRFVSVYDPQTEMSISSNLKNPNDAVYIKIINSGTEEGKTDPLKLDSLQQTDKSILKLDASVPVQTFKLKGEYAQSKFVIFPMYIQYMQNGKQAVALNSKIYIVKE